MVVLEYVRYETIGMGRISLASYMLTVHQVRRIRCISCMMHRARLRR